MGVAQSIAPTATLEDLGVQFTIGLDIAQMFGAWTCWNRWSLEEHGREIEHDVWMNAFQNKVQSGRFFQIVGWAHGEPMAAVEGELSYDMMTRKVVVTGAYAWVDPKFRQAGVWAGFVDFIKDTCDLMGVDSLVAPMAAGSGKGASWLKDMYAKKGFELTGIYMTRSGETG